jgi:hypothetical protein
MLFETKTALLWGMNIAGNNKIFLILHAMCQIFLPGCKKIWNFLKDFHIKEVSTKFRINPSSENRAGISGPMDGRIR